MYSRTYQDLVNYNPLMKNTYYELVKIPVIYDEPPDAQPRFRWQTSNWYFGEPEPHMQKWDEKLRFTLGRMQAL